MVKRLKQKFIRFLFFVVISEDLANTTQPSTRWWSLLDSRRGYGTGLPSKLTLAFVKAIDQLYLILNCAKLRIVKSFALSWNNNEPRTLKQGISDETETMLWRRKRRINSLPKSALKALLTSSSYWRLKHAIALNIYLNN